MDEKGQRRYRALYADVANAPGCAQADRQKIYDKIQPLLAEDAPYVFRYTAKQPMVCNKRAGWR